MAFDYVHLHTHSEYSLLDGASDVSKLVDRVAQIGQKAIAVTDHGSISGAVHLFKAAKEKGIKPILGCELYICQAEDHRAQTPHDRYNHLLVLAENEEGYKNLIKITSEASLHGFYRKPRVSKRFLAEHASGLIGLSGCLSGEVCEELLGMQYDRAAQVAGQYQDIFGRGNFYLEIQDQGLDDEKKIHKDLFRLEKELGIPMVLTNDSHYLCGDDAHAHDVLLCIGTAAKVQDRDRMRFDGDQFYVKSAEEMAQLFPDHPELLSRTMEIAERCNFKLKPVDSPWPQFDVPEGHTVDSFFEEVCRKGFENRRQTTIAHLESIGQLRRPVAEYEARLNYEIGIIHKMQYSGYFLIVADFIRYARENGIPVGPGRGSGAGSLACYAMGITNIDPLQNGLIFERFLNPERVSMPDIDVDFCMNGRSRVIDYVTEKYGREQVAQIITFNTLAARASIKDCGRALDMPYAEVDKLAKMIPATVGITLAKAIEDNPELQRLYNSDERVRELLNTSMRLEGLVRGAGVHASAVVIAPQPLQDLVPVAASKNDEVVIAYDMDSVEKAGLLKFDFLGLTTLTVIDDCLKLIALHRGERVNLETLPMNDAETFEKVFHTGLTAGVFQFESSGMRDVLRRYKPDTVEDLTALNALYRPGPIQGGFIDDFIERKCGRKKVEYALPQLEAILKETLGVIVYQESVMQIANVVSGYSLGEADLLRRAMGKKKPEEMAKQRDRFMKGAVELGNPADIAEQLFDQMEKFAGYGFNKSHAAAYALLAYQTAYLKTRYPTEFMAALLTSEISKADNVVKYIGECKEMGIAVEPPDVQVSGAQFTPNGEAIRFGLAAVKNVGVTAVEAIMAARQKEGGRFTTFWKFTEAVDHRLLNKRVIESLIKAGALDSLGRRAQLYASVDKAIENAATAHKDADLGQAGLFGFLPPEGDGLDLPNVPEWEEGVRLTNEKEVLGFYVSGHPLDRYREKMSAIMGLLTVTEALETKPSEPRSSTRQKSQFDSEVIHLAGLLLDVKVQRSKRDSRLYAQAILEDQTGKIELVCFPRDFERVGDRFKIETPVLVRGNLIGDDESPRKVSVSWIEPLAEAGVAPPKEVRVRINVDTGTSELLFALREAAASSPGSCKLSLHMVKAGVFDAILGSEEMKVTPSRDWIRRIEELVGKESVKVIT